MGAAASRRRSRHSTPSGEQELMYACLREPRILNYVAGALTTRHSPSKSVASALSARMLGAPRPWAPTQLRKNSLGGINSEFQALYLSCTAPRSVLGRRVNAIARAGTTSKLRLWPIERNPNDPTQRADCEKPGTPLRARAWRTDYWRCADGDIEVYAPMADTLRTFDGNGVFGHPNPYDTLSGVPMPKHPRAKSRSKCATVLDAEVLRDWADVMLLPEVAALIDRLPEGAGKRIMKHAVALTPATPENMSVCVCLLACQIAKGLGHKEFGEEKLTTAMTWLNNKMGVAEGHVGDLYKPSRALAHFVLKRHEAVATSFFLDPALRTPVPKPPVGVNWFILEKGTTLYRGESSYELTVKLFVGKVDLKVIFYGNPGGGPGLIGVMGQVEIEALTADLFGVPFVNAWPHTSLLQTMIDQRWFPYEAAPNCCAAVWRHIPAGVGGSQLLAVTDGAAVAVVWTNMSEALFWWTGRYPEHLVKPAWFVRCLPSRGSPAWANTNHPVDRTGQPGRTDGPTEMCARSKVEDHQKLLGLALVASGAVDTLPADWPTPRAGSQWTADSLEGKAYCTVVENGFKDSEVGTGAQPRSGVVDATWAAKLAELERYLLNPRRGAGKT